MTLNEATRRRIMTHVKEMFFPREVDDAVWKSINEMLKDYLTSIYGDPFHPVGNLSSDWLYIIPGDGVLDPFPVNIPIFRDGFSVPFIKRCPELDTTSSHRKFVVMMDNCPVPGLRDTVEALLIAFEIAASLSAAEVSLGSRSFAVYKSISCNVKLSYTMSDCGTYPISFFSESKFLYKSTPLINTLP